MDVKRLLYSEISFVPSNHQNSNNNHHHQQQQQNNNGYQQRNGSQNGSTNSNSINNNNNSNDSSNNNNNNKHVDVQTKSDITPKHQLCDPSLIKLNWLQQESIGGGLVNVGNTCFLNSVLQCLTYCPPLYNFLTKLNGGHSNSCKIDQFCMLCEMEKHIRRIRTSNGSAIKPISIVQRLKYINKSFQFGRQEDAHEFLRYVLDHMWKACLINVNINDKDTKLDPRTKETTYINQIFGGYHRSQVLCLTCNSRSNTFDFFMDFILDIRGAKSLEEALRKFTQAETLERENAYQCGTCRKKVTARKRFTIFKAPNVATFQLKRFDSDKIFGGKITKFISYPEELDLRPFMSDSASKPAINYHLNAVLVHVGHSSNSGHYFCFIKNSYGHWYRMDDANVSMVSRNFVLQQQAYLLFYTRTSKPSDMKSSLSDTLCLKKTMNGGATKPIVNQPHSQNHIKSPQIKRFRFDVDGNNKRKSTWITTTAAVTSTMTNGKQHNHNSIVTWLGSKSKLGEEHNMDEHGDDRDTFNEELDRGKTKKIKSRAVYCV